MVTSQDADNLAEQAIVDYVSKCDVRSAEDIKNALEMLLSKSARGIEKYCGTEAAMDITIRMSVSLAKQPKQVQH